MPTREQLKVIEKFLMDYPFVRIMKEKYEQSGKEANEEITRRLEMFTCINEVFSLLSENEK